MYKEIKFKNELAGIERILDHASIPLDPANTDYQAYLQFLADGGEPLPADEPEGQTA